MRVLPTKKRSEPYLLCWRVQVGRFEWAQSAMVTGFAYMLGERPACQADLVCILLKHLQYCVQYIVRSNPDVWDYTA
jgi:hypothetical protein